MELKSIASLIFLFITLCPLTSCKDYHEFEAMYLINLINPEYERVLRNKARTEYLMEVSNEPGLVGESVQADNEYIDFIKRASKILYKYRNYEFFEKDLERLIRRFPRPTYESLSNTDYETMLEATDNLSSIYTNVKLCSYREPDICNLTLIPDIQDILHATNDVEEIKFYWIKWRTATGPRSRQAFEQFVTLYKKAAAVNNFTKPSEMWYREFDDNNVLNDAEDLIRKIHPLFIQFHAHIRYLLQQKYGLELIKSDRPYPVHLSEALLGEVYRYQTDGYVELPYPKKMVPNVTEELIRQGYTPKKMFDASRDFYESIGFPKVPDTFWDNYAKPVVNADKLVLECLNNAWQSYVVHNVAFTYCPNVDYWHYLNMHKAVSDFYYYSFFENQPVILQKEPMPNFEDVFSEQIELSLASAKHLEKVGLIAKGTIDDETRLNRLYLQGVEKAFLLPILFILDKYRIQILDGEIESWDNCRYWKLTQKYTGSTPAVERTDDDFDAPAKLLTAVDAEYTSQILTTIMEYQVFRSLCKSVGEYVPGDPDKPLDNCDLSGYYHIGQLLRKAMSLGASKHWREILEMLTGQTTIDPSGYLEYFSPLMDWLVKDNMKNNLTIGWMDTINCIDNQPSSKVE